MTSTEKNWMIKPAADSIAVKQLADDLNISLTLSNLLVQRGITNFQEAKYFFRPEIEHLHDPFLMKDMDKAIERILLAIERKEKILIYGDYDVDGTTAVALVYSFLKSRHDDIDYYIPNRYVEGYGISSQSIEFAAIEGIHLIIALDCGIKSMDKVDMAKEKGIDFIICDHHLPEEKIPDAIAVLDPKRVDCLYPFKELSGCGIGFKLIQAFAEKTGIAFETLIPYLDLVVVSIAADIVHITDENRVLAHFGLKQLNESPRPGFKALIALSNVKKPSMSITDIVFTIGPRINAAGRIEDAKEAVKLLISTTEEAANASGIVINSKNTERITLDHDITKQAMEMVANDQNFHLKKSNVLYNTHWSKGVIGIVASRLTEKFYKPTIVLTNFEGVVSGSARSVKRFDVYKAIAACKDLLTQFGGHQFAAGLTMKPENVDAFIEKFEQIVSSTIDDDMLVQEIEIDAEVDFAELTPKFSRILKQFGPFGPGNMAPIFTTKDVRYKSLRVLKDTHLAVTVGSGNVHMDAIGFNLGFHEQKVKENKPFSICYSVEENIWQGNTSTKLHLKDIKHN